jgi:hypothetical protein
MSDKIISIDRKALARRLVLEKAILDALQEANDKARELARSIFGARDADSVTEGELELGRVSRNRRTDTAKVRLGQEFLEWVGRNHPEQIQGGEEFQHANADGLQYLREHFPAGLDTDVDPATIFPAYVKTLEARVKKDQGGWSEMWIDENGEERFERPDWISFESKPGNLVVEVEAAAREYVADLLAERLPELEP